MDLDFGTALLAEAASAAGARIATGQRVVRLVTESGRVGGVETASGARYPADVVVSCLGRWTSDLAALVGLAVPMAPTFGLTVVTAPSPVRLRAVVHHPHLNIRPDGAGRIMMQADDFDQQVDGTTAVEPLPPQAQDLFARTSAILPALAGVRIETARVGMRAIPADGYSVVGPVSHLPGLYLLATHSAITLGPFLARLAAREIMGGPPDPRLAAFRPERLVGK